jgi:hypothetical protein
MALVPPLQLPFIFVNGTTIDAGQVNADFAAVTNAVNATSLNMLSAPATFYVAPGGADVPGNGLSITSPCATVSYVFNLLLDAYNLNNNGATIQLANGTYTEAITCNGAVQGQAAAAQVIIQGNVSSPNLVTIVGNPYCLAAGNGALVQIQGVTLQSTSQCLVTNNHSHMNVQNCIFGPATDAHMMALRFSTILTTGNYSINGGGACHAKVIEAGGIFIEPNVADPQSNPLGQPVIAISGTPAFSNAFLFATDTGFIKCGAAFTGTGATGVRTSATMNGVINIRGQGAAYVPGSIAGTTATGGQVL